ncbi:undecaprenyldiphospho-muramoylpentapeptide beta-N-acetylglucosaminyltransferase [Hoeflea prorocentri]|uniref:UDP-N-acetylglucosamine--N-acetylmuramyl-(pentapeptide) pyrophosphoryl-undecaprenol N-acetylglucosamine transferase n=1 Tax=Hoeflea prorocentri TaxID=1922333 RepID=A0A9X3UIP7_9HYPH|nr:undecaprenyldiphospho-muramoylpentapeptide beta-N-acetylglucosaminyltransferase [Hoeflea prorocentri]MCY6379909.1 undecaprenyldiphospho-muramoylpentapeptide beta-N-acetylglucosaminyltransferase [Hoeflea prorocentri]MDA5397709.1 undecaprenyldiphospho-muramoylpentapeptide beta-N-acetylglucosaminyltransferase [Hoeflea prorocentri]
MAASVLLCAGGTGGHLFPAEALGHELRGRGFSVHLATDERAERFSGTFPADEIHIIPSATITSKNPIALAKTGLKLFRGLRQSGRLLSRLRPATVVGFGGYPTLPPLMAASRGGIPSVIHEQNAVMGRANKFLASRVDVIAGGFLPEGEGPFGDKIVTTGNPVRPDVQKAAETEYRSPKGDETFHLLVFGGSQGARFFSEILPEALVRVPEQLRSRLRITQQARPEDRGTVERFYEDNVVDADVSPFFEDMAERIARAHLVISRSGASTVSELSVIGRPSILVPFPYALDHDQAANAAALQDKGGAQLIRQSELSAEKLASLLTAFMEQPHLLEEMAKRAKSAGKPDAASLLGDLVADIASGKSPLEKRSAQQ